MRRRARLALTTSLLALAAGAASATTIPRLDLADLVEASGIVFTGTVLDKLGEWQDGRIVTRNTVSVDDVVKAEAEAPSSITITTLGGEAGGVGLWVAGESRFEVGGRYLIFVRGSPDQATWKVTGMAQGCLRIIRDEGGTDWVLPPQAAGIVTWKNGRLVPALPFLTRPVPLEELLERVRGLVEQEP
jgi:hypothetical protein